MWEVGSQGVTLESAHCNFGNLSSIEETKILGHWFKNLLFVFLKLCGF